MARMQCKCGNHLSTVDAPNDVQLHIYTDKEWDVIINMADYLDPLSIPDPNKEVWRCIHCDRIYVFNEDNTVNKVYVVEKVGS
ncbi:hypothetical protein HOO54_13605 [Bacillus sp. WMMC1349]|uniref:hypothetical protein n=1 Tax=Bacillus sp. WMMC1349 TaxID=2736254 RepID=UPI001554B264|nr:hypothetical protein [Bacillus sp. WMMC1349]NPC93240.1 hypothetical protein [Bacillus sp. WMMC1349]